VLPRSQKIAAKLKKGRLKIYAAKKLAAEKKIIFAAEFFHQHPYFFVDPAEKFGQELATLRGAAGMAWHAILSLFSYRPLKRRERGKNRENKAKTRQAVGKITRSAR
jgi:hypothetical protein